MVEYSVAQLGFWFGRKQVSKFQKDFSSIILYKCVSLIRTDFSYFVIIQLLKNIANERFKKKLQ